MSVQDKVILITGGGKGIGRETARLLASQNNTVIITGRTERTLQDTVQDIGDQGAAATYRVGDVTVAKDCERIIQSVIEAYGRLDILINNAGMSMRGLFEDTTLDLFQKIMDINFMGAVNMSKYALEHIQKTQGSIIFISSLSGLKGLPGIAPYSTAKMALTGLAESLRCEVSQYHVHIGILYVGFTENDSDKQVFLGNGQLVDIKKRANQDSQSGVAKAVLKSLDKQKDSMVLTGLGKATKIMYQFLPNISNKILERYAIKKIQNI